MALYPVRKVLQYRLYYKTGKRVGLRLILVLLKSLLALIRLRKRLKPFGKLYSLLFGVYKFRVGLWLISLGLYILRPRRRKKKGGGKRKGGKGGKKRKKGGNKGKSGGGIKGRKGG